MEDIIPWDEWVEFVRPYYPNGKRGRPVKGIEKMLRIKNRFGFTKVRYRGIAKNFHKPNVLFASANLLMYAEAKKTIGESGGISAPF